MKLDLPDFFQYIVLEVMWGFGFTLEQIKKFSIYQIFLLYVHLLEKENLEWMKFESLKMILRPELYSHLAGERRINEKFDIMTQEFLNA